MRSAPLVLHRTQKAVARFTLPQPFLPFSLALKKGDATIFTHKEVSNAKESENIGTELSTPYCS